MNEFLLYRRYLAGQLLKTEPFHTGEVHAQDTSKSKQHQTYELTNVKVDFEVPSAHDELVTAVSPHLPWAGMHFEERVSTIPHNPPPSHNYWPWSTYNASHMDDGKFSHTYPERYWPKLANPAELTIDDEPHRRGVRYPYGDLSDVVDLLVRSPLTRQAYLPVWFPEDTGATEHQRVPCSLGYHFMIRNSRMDCWYSLRSCDFIRHFQDDIYLTCRLMQWVVEQWQERTTFKAMDEHPEIQDWSAPPLFPGSLHVTISSLHAFTGDTYVLTRISGGTWQ